MTKKSKLKLGIRTWFDQALFGLSLSLLASGVVSSLMANEKLVQNILLFVVSFIGMTLSFLYRILPILMEDE